MVMSAILIGLAFPATANAIVVAIDVGHTSERPGATSARGLSEFLFNKSLARALAGALSVYPNVTPIIINEPDYALGLTQRAAKAAELGAQVLVSIHHDSVQEQFLSEARYDGKTYRYSRKARGYSLFVSQRNARYDESVRLAEAVANQLRGSQFQFSPYHAEDIDGERRLFVNDRLGIFRYDGLAVLRTARMPAILIEAGFIVHPEEEVALADGARQARMAGAIAKGIAAYTGNAHQASVH